ncbi:hypothetical protein FACS189499_00130 [Clostridia bacterium]|nr:hypothetical protein FACS189499_00130 [Clostridia bacterium]
MTEIERKNLVYLDTYDTARENPKFYSDTEMNKCIADADLKINVLFNPAKPVLSQSHVFDSAPFIQSLTDEPDEFIKTIRNGEIRLSLFNKGSFRDALVASLDGAKDGRFEFSGLPYISSLKSGSQEFMEACSELKDKVNNGGNYLASETDKQRKKLDEFLNGLYAIDSYLKDNTIGYVQAKSAKIELKDYLSKFIEDNKHEDNKYVKYIRSAYEDAQKSEMANSRSFYFKKFDLNIDRKALINIIDSFYNIVLCDSNTNSVESFSPTFPELDKKDAFIDTFNKFISEEYNNYYSKQGIRTFNLSKAQYINNRQNFEALNWKDVNYYLENFKDKPFDSKDMKKRSEEILKFCIETCKDAKNKIRIYNRDGVFKVCVSVIATASARAIADELLPVDSAFATEIVTNIVKKIPEKLVELPLKILPSGMLLFGDRIDIKEEKEILKRFEPLKEIATLVNEGITADK